MYYIDYLYPSILQIIVADSDESQLWMHAGRHDVVFVEYSSSTPSPLSPISPFSRTTLL